MSTKPIDEFLQDCTVWLEKIAAAKQREEAAYAVINNAQLEKKAFRALARGAGRFALGAGRLADASGRGLSRLGDKLLRAGAKPKPITLQNPLAKQVSAALKSGKPQPKLIRNADGSVAIGSPLKAPKPAAKPTQQPRKPATPAAPEAPVPPPKGNSTSTSTPPPQTKGQQVTETPAATKGQQVTETPAAKPADAKTPVEPPKGNSTSTSTPPPQTKGQQVTETPAATKGQQVTETPAAKPADAKTPVEPPNGQAAQGTQAGTSAQPGAGTEAAAGAAQPGRFGKIMPYALIGGAGFLAGRSTAPDPVYTSPAMVHNNMMYQQSQQAATPNIY